MKKLFVLSAIALCLPFAVQAHDHGDAGHGAVEVSDAWVRATVPQQRATGAFMTLTSKDGARLVAAESPAAKIVEVHEMSMSADNVMRMRQVDAVELPAGKAVELKPGGYHVMLIDLAEQVKEGAHVPLTLTIETADGKRESVEVEATARALTQQHGGASSGHGEHKHH